ncbi:hypothetical protein OHR86_28000 [Streptomyces sp. NBC_00441]|uniref:hypothetical protein n=1 Tax=Streptomyces sp. NBC_00441 TaxID=2975742 RepID=UPI002E28D955|nr:hypothetical protein [Streptomyces sp. NBC_00441]
MTLTREQLLHLADRARRGVLLPDEGALLADGVVELAKYADQTEDLLRVAHETSNKSEAERARAAAVLDRVRALHREECLTAKAIKRGLTHTGLTCSTCAALDQAQQPTTEARCHPGPYADCPACHTEQQPTTAEPPTHLPDGGNAEDCPACRPEIDKTVLYPWICPGPSTEQQPTA